MRLVAIHTTDMLHPLWSCRSPHKPLSPQPVTTDSNQVFGFNAPSPLTSMAFTSSTRPDHSQPIAMNGHTYYSAHRDLTNSYNIGLENGLHHQLKVSSCLPVTTVSIKL